MTSPQRVGALEVLRVALMRGDLDDVRNQMARALALKRHSPEALEGLLGGLEGIGIDLSRARASLGGAPTVNARGAVGPRVWRDEDSPKRECVCARRGAWERAVAVDQGKDVVMARPSKENMASAALPKASRRRKDAAADTGRRGRARGSRSAAGNWKGAFMKDA
ncbi:hypothetical protein PHLGIDRAFT_356914 [Phlebiopsis gigantea 11061_1 CR5-6]|uniref:Uncharacterized protein n=1 Tax=Phlebiopsis gigantea (strain 11061_1 CR5-6) TaxID=745531 RepID=A0A0C3SCI7_PHLG1|nr:hypothetical protein PHLGIDRAFT_356914 [Phlebiopsis gigantea 11061_1 CR5-6]